MASLSNTAEVIEFVATERAAGAHSDHFEALARDASRLATSYEDDVRIFPKGSRLSVEGTAKASALRASAAVLTSAAAEVRSEEEQDAAERAAEQRRRAEAYFIRHAPEPLFQWAARKASE